MPAAVAEGLAAALLLGTLWFAVAAPKGLPEVTAAAPAAAIAVLTGLVPAGVALDEVRAVAPTMGFLAAVLVLADLCDAEGLFTEAGALLTRASGRDPHRLLALVFVAAALATAVLSLDATIVLLTPVVYACATRLRMRARPHVYARAHLANAASLLLPVSNLTNLLALRASGLSFTGFAAAMALPWVVVVAVEYVAFRWFFATDLAIAGSLPAAGATPSGDGDGDGVPWFAVAVLGLTLLGFTASSGLGLDPACPAAAGALLLAGHRLVVLAGRDPARRAQAWREQAVGVVRAANVPFLGFVLALGVVVRAVQDHGARTWLGMLLPGGSGLLALLGVALVAAVLANLVNNLPATLMMLPAVAGQGAGPVLAALIGVNVGPNLTYAGSLATLLWRRLLRHRAAEPELGEFLRLGALTVPPTLIGGVLALWVGVRLTGG